MNFLTKTLFAFGSMAILGSAAMADQVGYVASSSGDAYKSMACAFALGVAALGGTYSQARTASTALEAIGRNPAAADKVFLPMIIGLALIESLVLYAFVIALLKI